MAGGSGIRCRFGGGVRPAAKDEFVFSGWRQHSGSGRGCGSGVCLSDLLGTKWRVGYRTIPAVRDQRPDERRASHGG